ncbi:MAG: hypothetical protein WEA09_15780 [Gemmatimonadota bacterium]
MKVNRKSRRASWKGGWPSDTGFRAAFLWMVVFGLAACQTESVLVPADEPAPPRALEGWYYAGVVELSWELHPSWDDDSFRVYGKRVTDGDYFFIAEVTSCTAGVCNYTDANVLPGVTYEYYVTAVSPRSGLETASEWSVEVAVPQPNPPPIPADLFAVAMDGSIYLTWSANAQQADDFAFYRIYLESDESTFLLGETDSPGFLDLRVENGSTYAYFVTSVDQQGHESQGGSLAEGTPRPDYHGEFIYAHEDLPEQSGFRFMPSEADDPLLPGNDPRRHFRLEVDADGWWLVPGADTQVHGEIFATTGLKCGPGTDAGCVALEVAPQGNYSGQDMGLVPLHSYVLRYIGDDGLLRYGVIRVTLLGSDQDGNGLMVFDWAHQLQGGNPNLTPSSQLPLIRH